MKKIFSYIFFILVIALVVIYRDNITGYITKNIIKQEEPPKLKFNKYYLTKNFNYIKITDDFTVDNKEELKDIFYTILDSGDEAFTFYCNTEYKNCQNDVKDFFNDQFILTNINNFVHPYNSFKNLKLTISNYGKINLNIYKIYNDEQINYVDTQIDNFIKENINDDMNIADKIKAFHDYIINNTKFDVEIENSENKLESNSYTAYGLLANHLAICGGYSDAMAIYLTKLGVTNYKISTSEHVWNLVNLDDKWFHLDATWDDPVTSDNSDMLMYDYYLIDTNTLLGKDMTQHNFDKDVYSEAK